MMEAAIVRPPPSGLPARWMDRNEYIGELDPVTKALTAPPPADPPSPVSDPGTPHRQDFDARLASRPSVAVLKPFSSRDPSSATLVWLPPKGPK